MRTAQPGDCVLVHYVKRRQDGSVASSRGREPLEVTVGIDHPRLPGLGPALVGLSAGQSARVNVPSEQARGVRDPGRVRRWPRERFADHLTLQPGELVRYTDQKGRRRTVRVLEASAKAVVVDADCRRAGQALELEVEIVSFQVVSGAGGDSGVAG